MPNLYSVIVTIIAIFLMVVLVCNLIQRRKEPVIGTLNIDTSGEEKDVYSFDILVPLEDLPKNKRVKLNIRLKE